MHLADASLNSVPHHLHGLQILGRLHEAGVVHSGLSPRRFRIPSAGRLVLTGLDHARLNGQRTSATGVPGFQAPEQLEPLATLSPATDVYAIATCIYRALTARFPSGKHRSKCMGKPGHPPKAPSSRTKCITLRLDEVLLRALSQAPDRRQASARVFHDELARALGYATEVDSAGPPFVSLPRQAVRTLAHVAVQAAAVPVKMLATPRRRVAITTAAVTLSLAFLGRHIVDSVYQPGNPDQHSPAQPQLDAAFATEPEVLVEFHTWPPAVVYIDGEWIVEAPSPDRFPPTARQHDLRLVPKTGSPQSLRLHIDGAGHYRLKLNLENGRAELEKASQP